MVGAGTIAGAYVDSLRRTPGFEPVTICARRADTARDFAVRHGLTAAPLAAMLADPRVDYVLNLTPAAAHETVTRACLEAGKSVYSEKPLATTLAGADALIALAEARGLLLACAPATFLWPPLATARRLVAEGVLGRISGALSTLVYPGPEIFHPNPAHLYGPGAGPLHDMGVYQVTALLALLGPVTAVSAMASRAQAKRRVRVGPAAGQLFDVVGPTHIHAQLRHAAGPISSMVISFDALSAAAPRLDLFGQAAGLSIVDPHLPEAQVYRCDRPGERHPMVLDNASTELAIGATNAWLEFAQGIAVTASAQRARDTLRVLSAILCATQSEATANL